MTGEDEDEEALAALTGLPADDVAGHWTIQQTTAFLIYGDPLQPLPELGSEEGILDRAIQILTADIQTGRIALFGRWQPRFDKLHPARTRHTKIPQEELLGRVLLDNQLAPPSQSWLFVQDPGFPSGHKIWMNVLIPAGRMTELHPTPLLVSDGAMLIIGANSDLGVSDACAHEESPAFAEVSPEQTDRAVQQWFGNRVVDWPDDKPAPSETVDWCAFREHFGPDCKREVLRVARSQETPKEWRKQGPRKPWGEVRKSATNPPICTTQN